MREKQGESVPVKVELVNMRTILIFSGMFKSKSPSKVLCSSRPLSLGSTSTVGLEFSAEKQTKEIDDVKNDNDNDNNNNNNRNNNTAS